MAYYHVVLHTTKAPLVEVKFDLTREEVDTRILERYRTLQPIIFKGRTFSIKDLERVQIIETPHPSKDFQSDFSTFFANRGDIGWYYQEPGARNLSDELINTPTFATSSVSPQASLTKGSSDAVELICSRFHTIVMQLRERHGNRPTLEVTDEYDVQDLMHALLRLFFEDVRAEEVTPSYAGKSSRMDFFLPSEKMVVETKKTRLGLTAKEIGSQLIEDIVRYRKHPECKYLVCFVYDPEGRVVNPRGIEQDLSTNENNITVKVFIAPKGY